MSGASILTVAVAAFAVTSLLGLWLIPFLRRLRFGQTINETGPRWHQKKQGTPTMGGLMFVTGILAASFIGWGMYRLSGAVEELPRQLWQTESMKFFLGLLMAVGFGGIGFLDDYLKVVKRRGGGLGGRQRLLLQVLVASGYLAAVYLAGERGTALYIPFLGRLDVGLFYYPLAVILLLGVVNAVDLTDGLDGLCCSVTFVAAMGMMMVCSLLGYFTASLLATALAGGCLGFLVWNLYPAKVFMGDLGSMFLGGILAAAAFGAGVPTLLVLVGIVYFCEALSVAVQRIYYRLTHGKRLFKMTPVHHHFEMNGFSELQITVIFSLITAVGCLLAMLSVRFL